MVKDEVAIPVIGSNPTSVSGTLRIGSRYSATSYLDGKVSDTRIYDRALSEKEIRALYETRDPYYRNTAGSVTKRPTIITGTTQSLWTPRMLGEDLNFLADAYSPSPNTKVSDPDGDGTGESHGIKDLSGRRCGAESVNKAEWIPPQTSTLGGWEFDGEDDYYKKPENPSKSLTFGSVVRLNQTSSGQNADSETRLYADDTNGTFSIIRCYTGGNGVIGSYYKTGTNNEFTTAYSGWGEWHLLLLHRAEPNGINELWIDGEIIGSVTTGSPGTANTKSAHLGTGRSGGNHNVDARIAHVLELREFASASQIDRWFGWAAHRYGLTGKLPSGHPYKSAPPQV